MAAVILQATGLKRAFGGLRAVDGVDFDLHAGEIQALIGPNGAGKTTFVSLLSGRIAPDAGVITLDGRDITALPAHARVRLGVAYTFQITSIYPRLSVFDNVALAAQSRGARDLRAAVGEVLARVGLQDRTAQEAGTLSYGHQRLLEVAMGLALAPRVLILDEPTQGLAAGEIDDFVALIRGLVPQTSVLLIEHNMEVVMDLADRITVLNHGTVLARGTPAEIRANRAVQAAYLGGDDAAA
jgi:branched-chain amino acid transport system ATP-binding protein